MNVWPSEIGEHKYPTLKANYEMFKNEDMFVGELTEPRLIHATPKPLSCMFVAGTASHSLDYKQSAGGFIHGFRYTGTYVWHTEE